MGREQECFRWQATAIEGRIREYVTFVGPHPPAAAPKLGAGEPSHLKVSLLSWERD